MMCELGGARWDMGVGMERAGGAEDGWVPTRGPVFEPVEPGWGYEAASDCARRRRTVLGVRHE